MIVGCSGNSGDGDRAEPPTEDATDEAAPDSGRADVSPDLEGPGPQLSEDEVFERLAALGGQLAIGNGPEVLVARPDGLSLQVLDGSETVVAAQPTWSGDGTRLAWSSVSAQRQAVIIQDFDDDGLADGGGAVSSAEGLPIFYLQWSGDDGRLAYIRNAPTGGVVEVGTLEPGSPVQPRGEGAPFFISWSPGPDRILAHVGGRSIELFDSAGGAAGFDSVAAVDGGFSAPAWVDERTALIVADGALTLLDVETGEREALVEVDEPVQFVLSPDRQRVAYQSLAPIEPADPVTAAGYRPAARSESAPALAQSVAPALVVLDLDTRDRVAVTTERSLAWEWSPDGDKLAWLVFVGDADRPLGRWHFWSRTGAPVAPRSSDFAITRKVGQAYLPFFAQYTQSVTGWSPDSSAFAFAGSVGGERGVWIQLVTERAAPVRVAPGDFVTWGDGPSPPPRGSRALAI